MMASPTDIPTNSVGGFPGGCREDPLEEGMATHSSIPARRIPWTTEPAESDTAVRLTFYFFMHVCICVCMYVYVFMNVCVCVYTYVYILQ